MWQCECGCRGIAADLLLCPMCGKERGMPKATSGGASNAWEQPDGGLFEMQSEWETIAVSDDDGDPEPETAADTVVVPESAAPRVPKARKSAS